MGTLQLHGIVTIRAMLTACAHMGDRQADEEGRGPAALVDRLLREYDLGRVVRAACAEAGTPDREEQVAYCLVALVQKHERAGASSRGPGKRYPRLHLGRADFRDVLARWAREIAEHVRHWGPAHDAIHAEADRYEVTTLLSLIRVRRAGELHTATVDRLLGTLANGPSLADMSLDLARAAPPEPGAYVFQSPLDAWATLAVVNARGLQADPLKGNEPFEGPGPEDLVDAERTWLDEMRDVARRIGRLAETRMLLEDAIELAERFEAALAARAPLDPEAAAALHGIRAELLHELETLSQQKRGLPGMLAYVTLALSDAAKLQSIAILSLRRVELDPELREHLSASMRAVARDEGEPTAGFVARVQAAGAALPASRLSTLRSLRERPERREAALAPVVRRLDGLPPVVHDLAAIGEAVGSSRSSVTTTRGTIVRELDAVDRRSARVFARYARMGV
jgi:hypothetical protein